MLPLHAGSHRSWRQIQPRIVLIFWYIHTLLAYEVEMTVNLQEEETDLALFPVTSAL